MSDTTYIETIENIVLLRLQQSLSKESLRENYGNYLRQSEINPPVDSDLGAKDKTLNFGIFLRFGDALSLQMSDSPRATAYPEKDKLDTACKNRISLVLSVRNLDNEITETYRVDKRAPLVALSGT